MTFDSSVYGRARARVLWGASSGGTVPTSLAVLDGQRHTVHGSWCMPYLFSKPVTKVSYTISSQFRPRDGYGMGETSSGEHTS